ncbi:MAG: tRNA (adenosine(37)-N6)-threonylcarbamoyltransferase complex dimerization subunit type 1 TsaB [Proteobacteria bacterium]|nr:MAG: tRNA (adenosine(37)-N6)-threonylcarbamoyltransferase complex dimerization subunit type 1 TsaB [Pseudomonadota bacterium]
MNLIAIETATEQCALGLLHNDQISSTAEIAPQQHASIILDRLEGLLSDAGLKKSQLDGIVFGLGPGAFTGVRIAFAVTQGLALALAIPVMGVSTLENMAWQVLKQNPDQEQHILIANDARMGEVYWAEFKAHQGRLTRLHADQVSKPEAVNLSDFDTAAGSAFHDLLREQIKDNETRHIDANILPDAQALLEIAQSRFPQDQQNIADIQPLYVRDKVVFS